MRIRRTEIVSRAALRSGVVIVLLAMLVSGCADRDALRRMQDQLNYLESSERRDRKDLERIDSLLTADISANQEMRADVSTVLSELRGEVAAVKENLADLGNKIDRRGTEYPVTVYPRQPGKDTARADSLPAFPPPGGEPITVNCGKLYEQGFDDLRKGNYTLAVQGFEEFLRTCGSSPDVPKALYWLGESHYANKDYAAAIEVFQRLVNEYPQYDRLPGALFRLGRSFEESDQPRHAKEYYERLLKEFPRAIEARSAEARLTDIKAKEGGG